MSRPVSSAPDPQTPADILGSPARIAQNARIAPLVRDAVARLHVVDNGVTYKAALVALRQTAGAPASVAQAYRAASPHEYMERWSLAKVLGDLHHPDALAPLREIAIAPLPAVTGDDAPQIVAEETMIRTAAVEGIARMAAKNPDARAALLKSLESPLRSVRRAAVQAFLAGGGSRAELEKALPADQRDLLDLRAVSAAGMPPTAPPAAATPGRETPVPPAK